MSEIEETRKPRAPFGKPTWILVGVGVLASLSGILMFMSSVSGSAKHAPPPAMARKLYTESPKTVASVAGDVSKQVNSESAAANTPQVVNTPQAYTVPPSTAYPPQPQGQSNGAEDYLRQARERRQAELSAPIMGIPPAWMTQQVEQQHPQVDGLAGQAGDQQQLMQLVASLNGAGVGTVSGGGAPAARAGAGFTPKKERLDDFRVPPGADNAWEGKTFKIIQGSVVHAALASDLNSDIPGKLVALASAPLLSYDQEHVLIPAGSRFLCDTERVSAMGQSRLGISCYTLITPDNFEISLKDNSQVGDEKGAGVGGHANQHLARAFGVSLAMGLLGSASLIGTGPAIAASGPEVLRYGFAAGMSNGAEQTLSRLSNVMPTITVKRGSPIDVLFTGDLKVPAWENHRVDPHQ
jgi:type IV secretion system protein VirB10